MKSIVLKNITHIYGKKTVLNDLTITLPIKQMVAICGPSGCGKTTLLNIIGLLERPSKGEVLYDGITLCANSSKAIKKLRYTIGFLFQNYGLSDNDTVLWNMMSAMEYVKAGKEEKKRRIAQALEKVGLSGIEEQNVCQLSGCELILSDEPTGNLDEENRDIVFSILRNLNQEGKTVIMVTHDPVLAERCDEIIWLNKN